MKNTLTSVLMLITILSFTSSKGQNLFEEAKQASSNGLHELALHKFNLVIKAAPEKSDYYLHRALLHIKMKNERDALADLSKSIELRPNLEAFYQRGIIHFSEGDTEAAKHDFEDARVFNGNYEKLNYYLGMTYMREKLYDLAAMNLFMHTQLYNDDVDVKYHLGICESKIGNYEGAVAALEDVAAAKKHWKAHYKLYEIHRDTRNTAKAIEHISKVIELHGERAEYFEERAWLYASTGNLFESTADRNKARTISASVIGGF